jgi:hypothetical protein
LVKLKISGSRKQNTDCTSRHNQNKISDLCTKEGNFARGLSSGEPYFYKTDVFKYLGVLVTTDNVVSKEIQARLKASNVFYYILHAALKSQRISRKVKLNIYTYT